MMAREHNGNRRRSPDSERRRRKERRDSREQTLNQLQHIIPEPENHYQVAVRQQQPSNSSYYESQSYEQRPSSYVAPPLPPQSQHGRARTLSSSAGSSSSSTSSSLLNISRPGRFGLTSFFTKASEKHRRRVRKQRSRRMFRFGNGSSSSDLSDLAYGRGYIDKKRSRDFTPPGRQNRRDASDVGERPGAPKRAQTDEEIIELGRKFAEIARQQNKEDQRRAGRHKASALVGAAAALTAFNKTNSGGRRSEDRGIGSSKHGRHHSSDESEWESASEDESSSEDDGLVYGSTTHLPSGGQQPIHISSPPPMSRPGEYERMLLHKPSIVDPKLFGPVNSLRGIVNTPCGFDKVDRGTISEGYQLPAAAGRNASIPQNEIVSYENRPMQHIYPVPTSDPDVYRAGRGSIITAEPESSRGRPAPVPIQQPKPIAPVSSKVFETTDADATYSRKSSSSGTALVGAAAAGLAGAAIASTLSDRKDNDDRRDRRERDEKRRSKQSDSKYADSVYSETRHGDDRDEKRRSRRADDKYGSKYAESTIGNERDEKRRSKRSDDKHTDEPDEKRKSRDDPERAERRREREKAKELEKEISRKDPDADRELEREKRRRDKDRDDESTYSREYRGHERREDRKKDKERRKEERREEKASASRSSDVDIYRRVEDPDHPSDRGPIDPFQFQIASTPQPGIPGRPLTPSVFTVDREPDFSTFDDDFQPPERMSRRDSYERELRDTESIYDSTRNSTAPIAASAIAAATAAIGLEQRRGRSRSRGGDETSRVREDNHDVVQDVANILYRRDLLARQAAEERSRSASPEHSVVEKWKDDQVSAAPEIVTPPSQITQKHKSPYDGPDADVRIDNVLSPKDLPLRPNGRPFVSRDPSAERERPMLNLVRPTPAPTPQPEKQRVREEPREDPPRERESKKEARKKKKNPPLVEQIRSVDDVVIGPRGEVVSTPSTPTSKGVTWGENQTRHYVVHSPERGNDEYSGARVVTPAETPKAKSGKKSGWGILASAIAGSGVGAAASALSDSGKDKGGDKDKERNETSSNTSSSSRKSREHDETSSNISSSSKRPKDRESPKARDRDEASSNVSSSSRKSRDRESPGSRDGYRDEVSSNISSGSKKSRDHDSYDSKGRAWDDIASNISTGSRKSRDRDSPEGKDIYRDEVSSNISSSSRRSRDQDALEDKNEIPSKDSSSSRKSRDSPKGKRPSMPWDEIEEPPVPGPKPVSPRGTPMPGSFAEDLAFTATIAAGLQDSGFDPNIVIDDAKYHRRDSPPTANGSSSFYQTPFAETATDLGSYPVETNGSKVGSEHGFILGEVAETPQDDKDIPLDSIDLSTLSKKERKKLEKTAKRNSVENYDDLKSQIVVEEEPEVSRAQSGPVPEPVPEEDDWASTTKLSKKEQKKRDKARAKALQEEESAVSTPRDSEPETPQPPADDDRGTTSKLSKKDRKKLEKAAEAKELQEDEVVENSTPQEPVSQPTEVELVDEWEDTSSKKKSKKDKKKDKAIVVQEEPRGLDNGHDSRISVPVDAFRDIQLEDQFAQPEDDWNVPSKKSKKSKRDSGAYDLTSEPATPLGTDLRGEVQEEAPIAQIDDEWGVPAKKSKKKSKRESAAYGFPSETATPLAEDVQKDVREEIPSAQPEEDWSAPSKKSKKKSKRESAAYEFPSETATPLEEDVQKDVREEIPSAQPEEDWSAPSKKSKKKSRDSEILDLPSQSTAPAETDTPRDLQEETPTTQPEDDWATSSTKKSKKKSKRNSEIYGSPSQPAILPEAEGARDIQENNNMQPEDDWSIPSKKSKKSKRESEKYGSPSRSVSQPEYMEDSKRVGGEGTSAIPDDEWDTSKKSKKHSKQDSFATDTTDWTNVPSVVSESMIRSQSTDYFSTAEPASVDDWEVPTKKSKKKSKRDSIAFDSPSQTPTERDDIVQSPKAMTESFSDLRSEKSSAPLGDDWDQPKKSKKKSKRDSQIYDSPSGSRSASLSRSHSEVGTSDKKKSKRDALINDSPSGTRSASLSRSQSEIGISDKKKSKRESYHESLPVSELGSESSERKSKKEKRRSLPGGFPDDFDADDRGDPPDRGRQYSFLDNDVSSVVSMPLRDRSEKRRSRKFDDPDDDAKSIASAPDGSRRKDSKSEKDKEKRNSAGPGLFDRFKSSIGITDDKDKSSRKDDDKKSLKDNAGTLGASVGLLGAAAALFQSQMSPSNATDVSSEKEAHSIPTTPSRQSPSPPRRRLSDSIDPEIVQREIRPAIDPQYGDLLPLPPSSPPGSPIIHETDDLPALPDSRPETPEHERQLFRDLRKKPSHIRRKSANETPTRMKSPSQSAIPLRFGVGKLKRPSEPASPGPRHPSPLSSPMLGPSEASSVGKSRPARPTSWDSTKEYKPLYLVEKTSRDTVASPVPGIEEDLPQLPESGPPSRESPGPEFEEREHNVHYEHARGLSDDLGLKLDIPAALSEAESAQLGSRETTPKAQSFEADAMSTPQQAGKTADEVELPPSSRTQGSDSPGPEPVESMSKDRSSYLLNSSPPSAVKKLQSTNDAQESPSRAFSKPSVLTDIPESTADDTSKGVVGLGLITGVAAGTAATVALVDDYSSQPLAEFQKGEEPADLAFTTSKKSKKGKKGKKSISTGFEDTSVSTPHSEPSQALEGPNVTKEVAEDESASVRTSKKSKKGKKGKKGLDWVHEPEPLDSIHSAADVPFTSDTQLVSVSDEIQSLPQSNEEQKWEPEPSESTALAADVPSTSDTEVLSVPDEIQSLSQSNEEQKAEPELEGPPLQRSTSSSKKGKKKKGKSPAWDAEPEPEPEPGLESEFDFVTPMEPEATQPVTADSSENSSKEPPIMTVNTQATSSESLQQATVEEPQATVAEEPLSTPRKSKKKGKKLQAVESRPEDAFSQDPNNTVSSEVVQDLPVLRSEYATPLKEPSFQLNPRIEAAQAKDTSFSPAAEAQELATLQPTSAEGQLTTDTSGHEPTTMEHTSLENFNGVQEPNVPAPVSADLQAESHADTMELNDARLAENRVPENVDEASLEPNPASSFSGESQLQMDPSFSGSQQDPRPTSGSGDNTIDRSAQPPASIDENANSRELPIDNTPTQEVTVVENSADWQDFGSKKKKSSKDKKRQSASWEPESEISAPVIEATGENLSRDVDVNEQLVEAQTPSDEPSLAAQHEMEATADDSWAMPVKSGKKGKKGKKNRQSAAFDDIGESPQHVVEDSPLPVDASNNSQAEPDLSCQPPASTSWADEFEESKPVVLDPVPEASTEPEPVLNVSKKQSKKDKRKNRASSQIDDGAPTTPNEQLQDPVVLPGTPLDALSSDPVLDQMGSANVEQPGPEKETIDDIWPSSSKKSKKDKKKRKVLFAGTSDEQLRDIELADRSAGTQLDSQQESQLTTDPESNTAQGSTQIQSESVGETTLLDDLPPHLGSALSEFDGIAEPDKSGPEAHFETPVGDNEASDDINNTRDSQEVELPQQTDHVIDNKPEGLPASNVSQIEADPQVESLPSKALPVVSADEEFPIVSKKSKKDKKMRKSKTEDILEESTSGTSTPKEEVNSNSPAAEDQQQSEPLQALPETQVVGETEQTKLEDQRPDGDEWGSFSTKKSKKDKKKKKGSQVQDNEPAQATSGELQVERPASLLPETTQAEPETGSLPLQIGSVPLPVEESMQHSTEATPIEQSQPSTQELESSQSTIPEARTAPEEAQQQLADDFVAHRSPSPTLNHQHSEMTPETQIATEEAVPALEQPLQAGDDEFALTTSKKDKKKKKRRSLAQEPELARKSSFEKMMDDWPANEPQVTPVQEETHSSEQPVEAQDDAFAAISSGTSKKDKKKKRASRVPSGECSTVPPDEVSAERRASPLPDASQPLGTEQDSKDLSIDDPQMQVDQPKLDDHPIVSEQSTELLSSVQGLDDQLVSNPQLMDAIQTITEQPGNEYELPATIDVTETLPIDISPAQLGVDTSDRSPPDDPHSGVNERELPEQQRESLSVESRPVEEEPTDIFAATKSKKDKKKKKRGSQIVAEEPVVTPVEDALTSMPESQSRELDIGESQIPGPSSQSQEPVVEDLSLPTPVPDEGNSLTEPEVFPAKKSKKDKKKKKQSASWDDDFSQEQTETPGTSTPAEQPEVELPITVNQQATEVPVPAEAPIEDDFAEFSTSKKSKKDKKKKKAASGWDFEEHQELQTPLEETRDIGNLDTELNQSINTTPLESSKQEEPLDIAPTKKSKKDKKKRASAWEAEPEPDLVTTEATGQSAIQEETAPAENEKLLDNRAVPQESSDVPESMQVDNGGNPLSDPLSSSQIVVVEEPKQAQLDVEQPNSSVPDEAITPAETLTPGDFITPGEFATPGDFNTPGDFVTPAEFATPFESNANDSAIPIVSSFSEAPIQDVGSSNLQSSETPLQEEETGYFVTKRSKKDKKKKRASQIQDLEPQAEPILSPVVEETPLPTEPVVGSEAILPKDLTVTQEVQSEDVSAEVTTDKGARKEKKKPKKSSQLQDWGPEPDTSSLTPVQEPASHLEQEPQPTPDHEQDSTDIVQLPAELTLVSSGAREVDDAPAPAEVQSEDFPDSTTAKKSKKDKKNKKKASQLQGWEPEPESSSLASTREPTSSESATGRLEQEQQSANTPAAGLSTSEHSTTETASLPSELSPVSSETGKDDMLASTEAPPDEFPDFASSKKSKKDKKKKRASQVPDRETESSTATTTQEQPTRPPTDLAMSEDLPPNISDSLAPNNDDSTEFFTSKTSKKAKKGVQIQEDLDRDALSVPAEEREVFSTPFEERDVFATPFEEIQQPQEILGEPAVSEPPVETVIEAPHVESSAPQNLPPEDEFPEFPTGKKSKKDKKKKKGLPAQLDAENRATNAPLEEALAAQEPLSDLPVTEQPSESSNKVVTDVEPSKDVQPEEEIPEVSSKKSKKDKKKSKKSAALLNEPELEPEQSTSVQVPIDDSSHSPTELSSSHDPDVAFAETSIPDQQREDVPAEKLDLTSRPESPTSHKQVPVEDSTITSQDAGLGNHQDLHAPHGPVLENAPEVVTTTPQDNSAEFSEFFVKKSKKGKKNSKSKAFDAMPWEDDDQVTSSQEIPEMPAVSQELKGDHPGISQAEQTPIFDLLREQTTALPAPLEETAANLTEVPESEARTESATVEPVEPQPESSQVVEEDLFPVVRKKSKKDKKKQKAFAQIDSEPTSGRQTPSTLDEQTRDLPIPESFPITSQHSTSHDVDEQPAFQKPLELEIAGKTVSEQPEPNEPVTEDWAEFGAKKSKKDKKKRKSKTQLESEPTSATQTPLADEIQSSRDLSGNLASVDLHEPLISEEPITKETTTEVPTAEMATTQEPAIQEPFQEETQEALPIEEEWPSYTSKKSKKDRKKRKSTGLLESDPSSGTQTPLAQEPALEGISTIAIAEELVPEGVESLPTEALEPVAAVEDEWALPSKKSKKDKKGNKKGKSSGATTPLEKPEPIILEPESSKAKDIWENDEFFRPQSSTPGVNKNDEFQQEITDAQRPGTPRGLSTSTIPPGLDVDLSPAQLTSHVDHDKPFDQTAQRGKKVRTVTFLGDAEIPEPISAIEPVSAMHESRSSPAEGLERTSPEPSASQTLHKVEVGDLHIQPQRQATPPSARNIALDYLDPESINQGNNTLDSAQDMANASPEPTPSRDFAVSYLESHSHNPGDILPQAEHKQQLAVETSSLPAITPRKEFAAAYFDPQPEDFGDNHKGVIVAEYPPNVDEPDINAQNADSNQFTEQDVAADLMTSRAGKSRKAEKSTTSQQNLAKEDESKDAEAAAAAAALTGGVAVLADKFGGSKKTKGKKGKKSKYVDKRQPKEDDFFDDPSLWESKDRKIVAEGDGGRLDNDTGDFWEVPADVEEDMSELPQEEEKGTEEGQARAPLHEIIASSLDSPESPVVGREEDTPKAAERGLLAEDKTEQPEIRSTEISNAELMRDIDDLDTSEIVPERTLEDASPHDTRQQMASPSRDMADWGRASIMSARSLPPVEEEPNEDHHDELHSQNRPRDVLRTPEINRDSGFITDSPRPARRSLFDDSANRDSGVHMKDWPEQASKRREGLSPFDESGARLSWESTESTKAAARDAHTPTAEDRRLRKSRLGHETTPRLDTPTKSSRETSPDPEKKNKPQVAETKTPRSGKYQGLGTGAGPALTPHAFGQRSTSDSLGREGRGRAEHAARRSASNTSISRLRTPEPLNLRPGSPGSMASLRSSGTDTPPLRRVDKRMSGDLRSLSQHNSGSTSSLLHSPHTHAHAHAHSPSRNSSFSDPAEPADRDRDAGLGLATAGLGLAASLRGKDKAADRRATETFSTPVANEGRVRQRDMPDVYDGVGEGRIGSPRSPTRPHSMRRRQSMQVLELESRLEQLVAENRMLTEARLQADSNSNQRAAVTINERDSLIEQLRSSLEEYKREVERLREVNEGLQSANAQLATQHNERYSHLEHQHASASSELEGVRGDYNKTLQEKDAEIEQLMNELEATKQQVRAMQQQILATKPADADFLRLKDEDHFDHRCQQLCAHVQQWVLRFSKFSDMRASRLTSELNDVKIVDRLDNTVLDGSDVDDYLSDRVKRRDIFMSMTMHMIWEYVFTRYLFGMDREQRQKLKTLEKLLSDVGPPHAVRQWRAVTLTLLSRRPAFGDQRNDDTEAVVQAILETLSKILPPPSNMENQIQSQLRRVLREAVDLSIEMRTQRAEFMMLPPLQPEYDANGDLADTVAFNAALMNERSGGSTSNEDLEAQGAVVRMVLFPLVIKKGDDNGVGDDEIVVCPAQVLIAKQNHRPNRMVTPSSEFGGAPLSRGATPSVGMKSAISLPMSPGSQIDDHMENAI